MKKKFSALLRLRFRALVAGFSKKATAKARSKGAKIGFAFLYLYVIVVFAGMSGSTFLSLAEPYHEAGLDWLYYAMAGLMSFGFALLGSVFTTRDQLYNAKDNDLMLSMPIPSWMILLSRMLPLLVLNLAFSSLVMLPAMVVHYMTVGFSAIEMIFSLVSLLCTTALALAIASVLGWLLHKLIQRMNKSVVTMVYLVVFLGVYFYFISQTNLILQSMSMNGVAISISIKAWGWPFFVMGMGCNGSFLHLLAFVGITAAVSGLVYLFLSVTFLSAAMSQSGSRKRRKINLTKVRSGSVRKALVMKELKRFLGSPTYLANMGMGMIMMVAMTVAGVIMRSDVAPILTLMPGLGGLVLAASLIFTSGLACISAPSISMEGKNLWILRSMPLSGKDVLEAKLLFHCLVAIPATVVCGMVLGLALGISLLETLLAVAAASLISLTSGLTGLLCGLRWPRFDWVSEAYPCKQAPSLLPAMFLGWAVVVSFGVVLLLLNMQFGVNIRSDVALAAFLAVCAALDLFLIRVLMTWGVKTWDNL